MQRLVPSPLRSFAAAAALALTACASAVGADDVHPTDAVADAPSDVPDVPDVPDVRDEGPDVADAPDGFPTWISCENQSCPAGMVCIHEGFPDAPDVCNTPHCWYRPETDGGSLTCDHAVGVLCRIQCDGVSGDDVYCDCD